MKIGWTRALLLLVGLHLSSLAMAVVPAAPELKAGAYLLRDFDTGRVLVESNADLRMEPASLTKMLTSYVVYAEMRAGHLRADDRVRVSERAWRRTGSRMFIEVGTEVSVEDLLHGLVVQSGNDAATALAEHIAGDERAFAGLMNEFAARLGMSASHFVNASGLPAAEHYTTARDMATLAVALIRDFPAQYPNYSMREFTYNGITQRNRNRLLWLDESVDGLKTGHTSSAGYGLVASAKRGDMRLVSAVLGSSSSKARTRQTRALLNFGFRFYETRQLFAAGDTLREVRVWQGERERLALGLEHDLYLTLPRGEFSRIDTGFETIERIVAPVAAGTHEGNVKLRLGDEVLAELPLVALHPVREGNLWRRASDYLRALME